MLRDLLRLLAREEVRTHPRSWDIYKPLVVDNDRFASMLNTFCNSGPLNPRLHDGGEDVAEEYLRPFFVASDLVEVLIVVMTRNPASEAGDVLEVLQLRVDSLCRASAQPSEKTQRLKDRMAALQRIKDAAAAGEDARAAAARAATIAAAAAVPRRGGRHVEYLTDPAHDRDYIIVPVTPAPEDLLNPPAALLPQNITEPQPPRRLLTFGGAAEVDDDGAEAAGRARSLIPAAQRVVKSYRSLDHYIK